jgi:hypothetical protein
VKASFQLAFVFYMGFTDQLMATTQRNFNQPPIGSNKYWSMAKVVALLLFPLVLLLLPATFFDGGGSICLSVLLADTACYGCGMTRAIMHLLHFDLETALTFNKLSVVVLPLLVFVWGQSVYRESMQLQRFYKSQGVYKKTASTK